MEKNDKIIIVKSGEFNGVRYNVGEIWVVLENNMNMHVKAMPLNGGKSTLISHQNLSAHGIECKLYTGPIQIFYEIY